MPTLQDTEAFARLYYGQPRAITNLLITGATEITVKGENVTIAVSQPVDPISMIPRDPGVAATLIQSAERAVTVGLGIYTAGQVMNKLSDRPQVIDRQVIEPTVVEVPK